MSDERQSPRVNEERPRRINVSALRITLDELAVAVANRVTHEYREELQQVHNGLPALLANMVRIAGATWKAVSVLTLDRQAGELPPLDLAAGVPPLARALLESAMTTVFIGEDTRNRLNWYYRAGWREAKEEYGKWEARYSAEPGWRAWSAVHVEWMESHDLDLQISAAEKANPKLATVAWKELSPQGFWPNPGKMASIVADAKRASFLAFVKEWSYAQLSQDSHLSYLGLARRGAPLAPEQTSEKRDIYRSHVCLVALALYLAVLSEVASMVGMPVEKRRLREIWEQLGAAREAAELWDARYRDLLV